MSGPIVRTGTTPEFWRNWDQAFGVKKQATGKKKGGKAEGSGAAKKAGKKAAKKSK